MDMRSYRSPDHRQITGPKRQRGVLVRPRLPAAIKRERPKDEARGKPEPAWRQRLVMMVRKPLAGRVKTRLAKGIGVIGATAFYRHASAGLIARLSRDTRWRMQLAVTPDGALGDYAWPGAVTLRRQGGGDLGQRMQRVLDRLPPGPALVIGSDSPDIRPAHIAAAFRGLGRADAVIGPAADGGYWLIGLKRTPKVLRPFRRVRWSSQHTLADTLSNLDGRRVEMLATLDDIDEADDLARSNGRHARRVLIPHASD